MIALTFGVVAVTLVVVARLANMPWKVSSVLTSRLQLMPMLKMPRQVFLVAWM